MRRRCHKGMLCQALCQGMHSTFPSSNRTWHSGARIAFRADPSSRANSMLWYLLLPKKGCHVRHENNIEFKLGRRESRAKGTFEFSNFCINLWFATRVIFRADPLLRANGLHWYLLLPKNRAPCPPPKKNTEVRSGRKGARAWLFEWVFYHRRGPPVVPIFSLRYVEHVLGCPIGGCRHFGQHSDVRHTILPRTKLNPRMHWGVFSYMWQ